MRRTMPVTRLCLSFSSVLELNVSVQLLHVMQTCLVVGEMIHLFKRVAFYCYYY